MKASLVLSAFALAATPVLAFWNPCVNQQGELQKVTARTFNEKATPQYWERPTAPSDAVEDYVRLMNQAIADLAVLFQARDQLKDYSKIIPPLALLSLSLGDVNYALLHHKAAVKDYDAMALQLIQLKDTAVPLVQGVAVLKTFPGISPDVIKRIVGILQSLVVAFDHFYQLLKVNTFAAARDTFAGYILSIICESDKTIKALDPTAVLTDADFCKDLNKPKCGDWTKVTKSPPAMDKCPKHDTRAFLYWAYQTGCFEISCQTDDWCKSLPPGLDLCKWKPADDQYVCNKSKPKPTIEGKGKCLPKSK